MAATKFHWADYLVFSLSLAASLGIGIYFALAGKKKKTTEDFLLGGRDMSVFPVAMSILASALNGVFILGFPAEIHYNGAIFSFVGFSFLISGIVLSQIFVPIYHQMNLTSAYEYFEKRYQFYPLRAAASITFIVTMLLFLAVVLYAPALAFSQVTSLSLEASVISCGLVGTLYTAFGGMKAVIWADTLQMIIMILGIIVLIIIGGVEAGTASEIWDALETDKRLNFNNWNMDMRVRHTVWGLIIGQSFVWAAAFGASQMTMQRFFAIRKLRDAQIAIYVALFSCTLMVALVTILGIIIHATYTGCDPIVSGLISKVDQIVPLFLMDVMGHLHGLPGLFTASVFAAALSSVSSAINSLAAVILEDFIRPAYYKKKQEDVPPKAALWISKGIAVFFGLLTIGVSFIAEYMGDLIIQMPLTIWGTLGCPLLAAFTLGIFIPFSNGKGVLAAMIMSEIFGLWMGVGGILNGNSPTPISDGLFDPTTGCIPVNAPPSGDPKTGALQDFWDISYCWYGMITFLSTFLFGILFSIMFDGCKIKKREIDPTLHGCDVKKQCLCCFYRNEVSPASDAVAMSKDNLGYQDDELDKPNGTTGGTKQNQLESSADGEVTAPGVIA